jgi:DNA repair protein RecO (recombination protein O)
VPATPDQALCIRHWDWSETSQTVSLFTRTHGIIRGLAKGSKREKSAVSGGIDLLTRGEVLAIIKPNTDLATLTAWDLQEIFPAIRRSLSAFHSAMYMADLVQHILHERDPHPALFDHLLVALRRMGAPEDDRRAVLRFQWATLVEAGYQPQLDADAATGAALPDARAFNFAPRLGGLTTNGPPPVWRVRAETVQLLRSIARDPGAADNSGAEPLDRANRLLASYLREILGRELPSAAGLFGDLGG